MKISLIVSTYNCPQLLEKVFWGLSIQKNVPSFEILIADDGSTEETAALIAAYQMKMPFSVQHIWQPDQGFQKCRILNKAIAESSGDYLIFLDGDCIPRQDFIAEHIKLAQKKRFLSGGCLRLSNALSACITKAEIDSQAAFSWAWLTQNGLKKNLQGLKLCSNGWKAHFLNSCTPTKRTWNGGNASCFKEAAILVNGFNENMQYGGEDCEFGDRLRNKGYQPKSVRYSAVCIHLEHARPYFHQDMLSKNAHIRKETQTQKLSWAALGLDQYL